MEQILIAGIFSGLMIFFWKRLVGLAALIFNFFVSRFEIHSSNGAYDYYLDFFDLYRSRFLKNSRFSYITKLRDSDRAGEWYGTIGYGWHLIRYNGTFILIYQFKTESMYSTYWENATIYAFSLNSKIFDEITNKLYQEASGSTTTKVNLFKKGSWQFLNIRSKRDINTVFWDKSKKEDLLNDINTFLYSKEKYIKQGIPYKRSYLFYGEPGTGKTSMAFALASHFNLNLSILNLSTVEDDNQLLEAFSTVPNKSILLLEDIDLIFQRLASDKKPNEKNLITFSGILNCLDGVSFKENLITILTTNHIDRLDSAVLRDGRIDRKIEVAKLNKDSALEMIIAKGINPKSLKLKYPINPAILQEELKQLKS